MYVYKGHVMSVKVVLHTGDTSCYRAPAPGLCATRAISTRTADDDGVFTAISPF